METDDIWQEISWISPIKGLSIYESLPIPRLKQKMESPFSVNYEELEEAVWASQGSWLTLMLTKDGLRLHMNMHSMLQLPSTWQTCFQNVAKDLWPAEVQNITKCVAKEFHWLICSRRPNKLYCISSSATVSPQIDADVLRAEAEDKEAKESIITDQLEAQQNSLSQ